MPIIFISSLPFGGGEDLAKRLAQKLGFSYLSREDVVAQANECGIPVGKLEMAMIKKPAVQERMARLKERYLAVATSAICEKAAGGKLVYFGRAGLHLLPGVSHVLRVYVVPNQDKRLASTMQRLRLSRQKASEFLESVDRDIRAWVRFVHGVDLEDTRKYDFVVNLENLSIENAAAALCGISELPDFTPTPASRKAMDEKLLQARARIKLALDERTAGADLTVRSGDGILVITYMPRQADPAARAIPEILKEIPGCREIRCTMASTNILWIQEQYHPESVVFRQVVELARRLGAAVELLRYSPEAAEEDHEALREPEVLHHPEHDGGIEDDTPVTPRGKDRLFLETVEALVNRGCSGGAQSVAGSREKLLAAISSSIPYSLIAVGDIFIGKTPPAKTRLTRDFVNFLARRVKPPVVSTGELGQRLKFSLKEGIAVAAAFLAVVLIYLLVFTHQATLLDVIGGAYHADHRWVAPLVIALTAPLVAALYGRMASFLLKLIKLE